MARGRKGEPEAAEKVKVTVKLPRALVLKAKMLALKRGMHLQDLLERGLRAQVKKGK